MADAASAADIRSFLKGWAQHENALTPGEYKAEEKSYDPYSLHHLRQPALKDA